jgi:hypothetical protein
LKTPITGDSARGCQPARQLRAAYEAMRVPNSHRANRTAASIPLKVDRYGSCAESAARKSKCLGNVSKQFGE